jgi:hypothetical protein
MIERRPNPEFGKRRPAAAAPAPPPKRSSHVALLVMGTLAVGGTAYALMPRERCEPASPGMAAPANPQDAAGCASRGSSGGGSGSHGYGSGSSRYGAYGSDSSSSHAAASSSSSSGGVVRGGFGAFAHAFGFGGG